ncbi:hypothetical protein HG535_0A04960 [Zygotorulaspora mrakii]|uniref:Vps53 N-terminal domain-containing protein n=1 Tax=Zygotorulaspora mrakii TaxID=42260 RepID=A0A7H9AW50_ZYGMR|nr:uncharacterized protein HG535_0A04960 [Zygotorulaspora mrakii]QLG70555.1 hypothetical protein HG535_0A04960 [Zygotorulaspora mrakii]
MISSGLEYDPTLDITTILSAKGSIEDIDKLINATRGYKLLLEEEIASDRKQEAAANEELSSKTFEFDKIFQDIEATRTFASTTQSTISHLTQGISHLDNAKRNLTLCMTVFQNLKILTDSYTRCKSLLAKDKFKESTSSYEIMCSLAENTFRPYKSVDEINRLLMSIARLRKDTFERIKQTYHKVIIGKAADAGQLESQLREGACVLLECDPSDKSQIIDWCIDKLLYEINEIFKLDDEAGSLENLSRRYIFFKKILNNFNSNFSRYFPQEWGMQLKLTNRFYEMTQRDLSILLDREFNGKGSSIDLFMGSLQTTLDFEKYIDVRFSNKLKGSKLSSCFKPYLSLWIAHQDKMMKDKLLTYMGSNTLDFTMSDSWIISSSADLFRTYRSVLSQTFELIENNADERVPILLANFFAKWLKAYLDKILKPLLLPPSVEIQNKEETIKYTVSLVNTSDYCSTTVEQLVVKLTEFSAETGKISQIFDEVKSDYDEVLAAGISILLNRIIQLDLSFVWKEFNNTDWSNVAVEDSSRYMVSMKNILSFATGQYVTDESSTLELILTKFNREVYTWNFLDKIIDLVTHDYSKYIILLLQRQPPFANLNAPRKFSPSTVTNIAEQFLLDLELLKNILNSILQGVSSSNQNSEGPAYKRVQKHIDANLELLLKFLKLLLAPLDSVDDYYETYKELTISNSNTSVWAFMLTLKGLEWDLALWKQYWTPFNLDSDDSTDEISKKNVLIFKWNPRLLQQFEYNMARVSEPAWSKFIRNELKISASRVNASRNQVDPHQQQQQQQSRSPVSPVLNVKNLVAGTRFFNRGV